jgi:hypothetical protein
MIAVYESISCCNILLQITKNKTLLNKGLYINVHINIYFHIRAENKRYYTLENNVKRARLQEY